MNLLRNHDVPTHSIGALRRAYRKWTRPFRHAVSLVRFRWFVGDLPDLSEPGSPGCWRLLTQRETGDWVRDHPTRRPDWRRMYEVAVENEHLLFVAFHEGRPVGHTWVGRGWTYIDSPDYVRVHLPADTAYSYDLYIDKAYRRQGLAYDGFLYRLHTVRQHGFRRYATGILDKNRVGHRHMMELGVPWWDSTRVSVADHAFWLKGKPWDRLGDKVLKERTPRRDVGATGA